MKTLAACATGLALAAVFAAPRVAVAQVAPGDSVTGHPFDCNDPVSEGTCDFRSTSVVLDAHSGPAGENPTGAVTWSFARGSPGSGSGGRGFVTCLSVNGNVAVIGFTGFETQGEAPVVVPVAGLIRATDRGGPGSAQDTFELNFVLGDPDGPPLPGPTDCTFPAPPGAGGFVNDVGDLTVVDTRAAPTSKDQCKNGGWRTYGVFKNQGDCVSFVATGGRNPPSKS